MKRGTKVFLCLLSVVLATLIVAACIYCGYYPHYKRNQHAAVIADKPLERGEMRIMSCNLRCANTSDLGKTSWFYRADLIVKNIEAEAPTIIGFQEATKWQYNYMCRTLTGYDSVMTFRDDTLIAEACPVFYRTDLYDLVDKGSFWLSETPEKMSRDWGSACYRICSYVILKEKQTGLDFVVFNTHLDHVSEEARIKGIGVVLDKISQFGSLPSMIMGDFNAEEGSVTYENVTKDFLDARYQVDNAYQNFGKELDRNRIDYFMISKTGINVKSYKVVTDTFDGVYPSDHFPITASLTLTQN